MGNVLWLEPQEAGGDGAAGVLGQAAPSPYLLPLGWGQWGF